MKLKDLFLSVLNKFKKNQPPELNLMLIKNPITDPEFKRFLPDIDAISEATPRDFMLSTEAVLKDKVLQKSYFWMLIIINDMAIGFFRCNPFRDNKNGYCIEINDFVIRPEYQRNHHGRIALNKLIHRITNNPSYIQLQKIILDCNSQKKWLIDFYKSMEFRQSGYSDRAYPTPHFKMVYLIKR